MSDPNQFRPLSISEITEDSVRADLATKKALVSKLSAVGAQVLVTGGPFILRETIKEEYYRVTGSYLNEVGEETRAHGMRLAHHPHLGTLFQGSEDVERLLDYTDEKVVGACLDTAHLPAAGVDPVSFVREHSKRIKHAHIKDVRDGKFVELGEGTVDLDSVFKELKNQGYDSWLVAELDIPSKTAYESSATNKRQLDRLIKNFS
jgi:inosose dehydratase